MDSKIPLTLPRVITYEDRMCDKCGTQNIFDYYPEKSLAIPICQKCSNINLLDSNAKIAVLEEEIREIDTELIEYGKHFDLETIHIFLIQLQNAIGPIFLDKKRINTTAIVIIAKFIQFVFENTTGNGGIHEKDIFIWMFEKFSVSESKKFLRNGLKYEIIYLDEMEKKYYSYMYLRRIDGLGEFNIGPQSMIDNFLKEYEEEYIEELRNAEKSKTLDIFESFQNDEIGIVLFHKIFSSTVQAEKSRKDLLNLNWLTEFSGDIKKIRKWRLKNFTSIDDAKKVDDVFNSLKEFLNEEEATNFYNNSFISKTNPKILPYGIEVNDKIRIAPFWGLFLELLFVTETEGEEKFQKLARDLSKIFEKQSIPEILKKLGLKVVSGFKEKNSKNIEIFEIDTFALDSNGILWVIESKSGIIPKRFLDSYKSWTEECREFVDRSEKRLTYPEIIEYISKNITIFQSKGKIPRDWDIKEVKGVILTQFPPFEFIYNEIYLLWYREIDVFFS